MKFFITAKPRAKTTLVTQVDDIHFVIAVREPPDRGRANAAVIKALADFLDIAPSRLHITSGRTGKNKVVELR